MKRTITAKSSYPRDSAAEELGASQDSICFWYRELERYGFIVMTQPGTIGPNGKATRWRVTDVGWGKLDGKSIDTDQGLSEMDRRSLRAGAAKIRKSPDQTAQGVRANRT